MRTSLVVKQFLDGARLVGDRGEPRWAAVEAAVVSIGPAARRAADAMVHDDVTGAAEALGELLARTYAAGWVAGVDLDGPLAEVYRANMSKLGPDGRPILRADGKVLKGEAFRPPDAAAGLVAEPLADPQGAVRHFHEVFGAAIASARVSHIPEALASLRTTLISEELDEVVDACEAHDLGHLALELADLLTVTYGAAVTFGVDLAPQAAEVGHALRDLAAAAGA